MAILRVKDNDGNVIPIPALKGEKGDRGAPGAGILLGSYVGNGGVQTIPFDGAVSAVLILTQEAERGVSNNGFLLRGGWVTDSLNDGSYELAYLGKPTADQSYLEVKNATYNAGSDTQYENGFNIYGTTYHYVAFMSEGASV